MNKFILHNHVTGTFDESYCKEDLEALFREKLELGAGVEDFQVYRATPMQIAAEKVIIDKYQFIEVIYASGLNS